MYKIFYIGTVVVVTIAGVNLFDGLNKLAVEGLQAASSSLVIAFVATMVSLLMAMVTAGSILAKKSQTTS